MDMLVSEEGTITESTRDVPGSSVGASGGSSLEREGPPGLTSGFSQIPKQEEPLPFLSRWRSCAQAPIPALLPLGALWWGRSHT